MPYYGDGSNITGVKDTDSRDDIALLGFKVAANGSLAKYDLVDQTIDAFEDASGVDASASTDEIRNAANYYSGSESTNVVAGFTTAESTTWTAPAGVTTAEILVVAGGGGGVGGYGGGGGAGGIVHHATYPITAAVEYDLTVGAGAAGRGVDAGYNGGNSSFNDNAEGSQAKMTAVGGGGGAYYYGPGGADPAQDGGSGGGGAYYGRPGGSGTQGDSGGGTGYGNDGGDGTPSSSDEGGAGGGGASTAGQDTVAADTGGYGGAGREFANFDAYGTNASNDSGATPGSGSGKGYFGGGGAGAAGTVGATPAPGGVGGGAVGRWPTGTSPSGFANTGGGGGGARQEGGTGIGGAGGTGVVLVKYLSETYNNMTLISNATTAIDGAPTKGDFVITYTNGAGTATINTDLKAYISRNNGSAYTSAVTLVSQGTTGGHTILTANNVDLSGITTGTSMRWKIETLNQAVGKQTRIQAVSLGWS